jgi:hypothetical protein
VWPALLMLGGLVVLNARWQKTFLLNLHRFIDTQGRGVHGPDERGLERLFTHNVKCLAFTSTFKNQKLSRVNYITVRWHVRKSLTSIRSRKPPDQRL